VSFLDTILEDKRREVAEAKKGTGFERMAAKAKDSEKPRSFVEAMKRKPFALIAEIKKASPSRGILLENFEPRALAAEFEAGGASALSVLTDRKHFRGEPSYIAEVKAVTGLPVLRKDFIVDEYQVYESRAIGADAILLIVRALEVEQLRHFSQLAESLSLGILVETHDEMEIEIANSIGANIIGINNRDLDTFEVRLETSLSLFRHIDSQAIAVSESGISSLADTTALKRAGFRAALVGEGIMTRSDRTAAVRGLIPE
jgi:indole-3-glycerol phosphate synthase